MARSIEITGLVATLAACNATPPGTGAQFGGDTEQADAETDGAASTGTPDTDTDTTNGTHVDTTDAAQPDEPKFDLGDDTGGVADCECGSRLAFSYVWVANSGQSTVSKINAQTLTEEGRYATRGDGQGDPSRTSVSLSGLAVAVANRWGGVTKVWADHASCDPNANGQPGLQTSTGPDDVLPWGEDDCIAWSTDFDYTSQRPIAWIAGQTDPRTCEPVGERLWTSGCNKFTQPNITVHRLDGDTGVVLDTVPVDDFPCIDLGGYGGAADASGNFWVSNHDVDSRLARVDAQTLEVEVIELPAIVYGITVDHRGRPWMACNDPSCTALRYDPGTQTFALATDHLIQAQSGIVQDGDGRMWVNWWWYDETYGSGIAPIDVETMQVGEPIVTPAGAKGIAVDLDGFVWSVAPQMNAAYRIDPASEAIAMVGGLSNPYTYSDMTGWALQNVACDPAG